LDRDLPLQEPTAEELSGQPEPLKAMRVHNVEVDHDSVVHQLEPSRASRHRQRAFYLANVTMIDEKIGEILAALSAAGYLDDAVVVFTSDHGDCLGDHGHSQKWTMYEQVLRVPLIVWGPGRVRAGARCDALVQQMDIVPFLLEQAGVSVPESFECESLAAALQGEEFAGRDAIYAEQMKDLILTEAEFVSAVRTRDHKLVHFLGQPCGQLYDLRNDPDETRNLWSDTSSTGVKRELLDRLMEWRIDSQYRTRNWMQAHR
jgi:arylsulfatase